MSDFNIPAFVALIELYMTEKGLPFEQRKERALAKIKQEHSTTLFENRLRWEDVPKVIHIEETDPVLKKLGFLWAYFASVEKATE